MKYFKLVLFITIIALIYTNKINATNYYVCDCDSASDPNCIAGNDSNSGTNVSSPWRTTSKVSSVINSLQAGDQILFAKGGAWTDASIGNIYNFNSSAGNPIIFDSYTPPWGGTAKPILVEARNETNLFNFIDGGNADHDEGYSIRNLNLNGGGTGQWGVFAYNDADYITLENLDISGFEIGVHCAGSNTPNPGADNQNQNMSLLNSMITNCSNQGFLGGADFLLIENCFFENNGFAQAVFNHNIYISDGDNIIIRNNELYRSAVINSMADGVSLVVHGMHNNLIIEGNYIHEDPGMTTGNAWGIGVDPGGYDIPEGVTGLVIKGNLITNMFNNCIAVTSTPGAIIENNVIINENAADLHAIVAPDRLRDSDDLPTTNITIRNNSIYLRNANTLTKAIIVGEEGTEHVVVSNVISIDNGNGLDLNLGDDNYESVNYNMMELINNAYWGEGQSLNSWSSSRGFDLQSLTGNPLFTSPEFPDYNLIPMSSSPLINAGHPVLSSPTDYTGALREGIADIGAFETFILSLPYNQSAHNETILSCFPNPTNGQIVIKSDASMIGLSYSVFNDKGQSVCTGKINSEEMILEFGNFSAGNFLIIVGENMKHTLKVIKK